MSVNATTSANNHYNIKAEEAQAEKAEKKEKTEKNQHDSGKHKGVNKEAAMEMANRLDKFVSNLDYSQYGYSDIRAENKTIDSMWTELEQKTDTIRQTIERIIKRQACECDCHKRGKGVESDPEIADEEEKPIEEDDYWGVNAVAGRIMDFAMALAGGDATRIDLLRDAVDQGFGLAKSALGGELPDISKKTYDEVMKRFDEWKEKSSAPASEEDEETA